MDLADIQGLVFHPYRRLPYAAYVLLRFEPDRPEAAKRWLATLVESQSIDSATPKDVGPHGRAGVRVNVAFTFTGLIALGLDADAQQTFPLAFTDGLGAMQRNGQQDHRSRALGDVDASAPPQWMWGYQGDGQDVDGRLHRDTRVDALLLVYATTQRDLLIEEDRWVTLGVQLGAFERERATFLYGEFPDDPNDPNAPVREPFGFVDGISQPVLKGALGKLREKGKPTQPERHELDDGEILLGYRDGSRRITISPTVAVGQDPNNVLPPTHHDPGRRDLGYNGTYLVFRQLSQDCQGFDDACDAASRQTGITKDRFKALAVGRWEDGSPLLKCPIAHDPMQAAGPAANDFGYGHDPHGERCPIGAHIRRANPRDSLVEDAEESWRVSNRHRILRRGRPYRDGPEEGLHFIGLNADIERQFEFIQQNWINADTFGGLDGEDDPMVGARLGRAALGALTLPPPAETRIHRRASGLARFVTVKGGGYFFLPSLTALRYLAGLPPGPEKLPAPAPVEARLSIPEWVQFLFLARFPILLGAILALMPVALLPDNTLASILRLMFLQSTPWAMVFVSATASLAAVAVMTTTRNLQMYARQRFDAAAPPAGVLTWRRILAWQALTVPTVVAALYLSVSDLSLPPTDANALGGFDSFLSLIWTDAGAFGRFGLAALGGYVLSFLVLRCADIGRSWIVRSTTAEDSLFVPASSRVVRLKSQPSWIEESTETRSWVARRAEAVVGFIEGVAASWPPERGAGYVDHHTGRILPGHLAAAALALTIGAIYLSGWLLLRPSMRFGFQFPPLAYVMFVLMFAGWWASGAAFFLDRFRIPLLTALAGWLAVVAVVGDSDHEFRVVPDRKVSAAPSVGALITSADKAYTDRGGSNAAARPIIVVAAGGGGVQQAAWTARVLTGLSALWGPAFTENVRLISAVSAGSVGAMHFVSRFSSNGPPRDLQAVVEAAKTSSTSEIWWGMAYPDLTRAFLLFPVKSLLPGTLDRGWALEQAWRRTMGLDGRHAPTIDEWQRDAVDGWRPAVAFNAMVVETGERVVFATYGFPEGSTTKGVAAITSGQDLSITTAARLSAAFPYVTPFARPDNSTGEGRVHLTDGGYWDNHAVVTALEWLKAAEPSIAGRPVLFIRIPPFPETKGSRAGDRSWAWQSTAPLTALVSMRTNAQEARNLLEMDQLENYEGPRKPIDFPYGRKLSLGWHLSRRDRCDIDNVWKTDYSGKLDAPPIKEIAGVLGPPRTDTSPLPEECRR